MTKPAQDFFNKEVAQRYDERNSKLSDISDISDISDALHFLIGLILKDLPTRSRVLCVGAGTGAEILALSRLYSEWSFVAVEPSLSMLDVCRERLTEAGLADRCEFVHGYVQDLKSQPDFDVALSILVAHFVKREERIDFFGQMTQRLKSGGFLVNAEISFDLDSAEFPSILENWKAVQRLMGGTPESLALLPKQLREMLAVLPPAETENLLRQSGIGLPVRFFQAFLISGWYGRKN